jgi:hypothetical protein
MQSGEILINHNEHCKMSLGGQPATVREELIGFTFSIKMRYFVFPQQGRHTVISHSPLIHPFVFADI